MIDRTSQVTSHKSQVTTSTATRTVVHDEGRVAYGYCSTICTRYVPLRQSENCFALDDFAFALPCLILACCLLCLGPGSSLFPTSAANQLSNHRRRRSGQTGSNGCEVSARAKRDMDSIILARTLPQSACHESAVIDVVVIVINSRPPHHRTHRLVKIDSMHHLMHNLQMAYRNAGAY